MKKLLFTLYCFLLSLFIVNLSCTSTGVPTSAIIFLSSGTYTGNMGGLSGADALCQNEADANNLSGYYFAFLSSYEAAIINRIPDAAFVNTNGATIAESRSSLFSSNILASIDYYPDGTQETAAFTVWTGTTSSGYLDSSNNCTGWISNTGTGRTGTGLMPASTDTLDSTWVYKESSDCSVARHIFCVQISN